MDRTRHRMHWTTRIGIAGVMLCVCVVATLNVIGWLNTFPGLPGKAAAVVAVGLELIAFVAWEHISKHRRDKDWGRLALAVLGLSLAAAVNIEGGHRGIVHLAAPLYAAAEADHERAQAERDRARAAINTEIAPVQQRVDDVPRPNCEGVGPDTCRSKTANWNDLTRDDRAAIASARARLDELPITVAYVAPFPAWGPYAVTTAFAFFSLFGLTMFGASVPGADSIGASRSARKPRPAPQPVRVGFWRRLAAAVGFASLATAPAVAAETPPATLSPTAAPETPAPQHTETPQRRGAVSKRGVSKPTPANERREGGPPVNAEQIERATKALSKRGERLSVRNVARELDVPPTRVQRSPAWRAKWAAA
jgi:hypothetical protein